MRSSDIQREIFNFLHNDNEIKEFCFTHFNQAGTVQLGLDKDEFPPQELMPVIVVGPISRLGKGDNDFITRYVLFLSVTIRNENVTRDPMDNQADAQSSTQGKIELEGATQVEQFRELVEEKLFKFRKHNMKINVTGETLTESDFPVFRSTTAAEIEIKRNTRQSLG
jgi:hypothetical protein